MNEEKLNIPIHVGIIMDGNGRWAKERGLKRSEGHKAGYKNLKKLAVHILNSGVKYLSVYAFSTENFKRDKEEVDYLMDLFVNKFKSDKNYFNRKNIKVVFSGLKEPLRDDVWESMQEITEITKNNTGGTFNILLNYGGQSEIVEACKKFANDVVNNNKQINDLNINSFKEYLHQNLPDIDFMIRTSGEERISNFMLYQISYAEMYFPKTYFPDFNNEEFDKSLLKFNKRDRRYGGIKKDSNESK